MAEFSGSGALILGGNAARAYDLSFAGTTSLTMSGIRQVARNIEGPVTVLGDRCTITESELNDVTVTGDDFLLTACVCNDPVSVTANRLRLIGNLMRSGTAGASVTGADAVIASNEFNSNGGGGEDALTVNGDGNMVQANKFIPDVGLTDHAVNIAGGDCNKVVGNDLGDPADYASDALIDSGTNTQLTYPNDPVYGDNFTDCIASS